ncbi:MAG: methyl-accepting chemotaxis protein [Xanthomonadales bacterium]|jgi:methyl-accepting chemotaxis protein|nr:methyl-accepting chemotaxis protein [Xanthomonadales bacterium]
MAQKPKALGTRSITFRLTFGLLGLVSLSLLLLAAALTYFSTRSSTDALEERLLGQLGSLQQVKRDETVAIFNSFITATRLMANSTSLAARIAELRTATDQVPGALTADPATRLQGLREFYTQKYEAEFLRRNDGTPSGMLERLDSLPERTQAMQYAYLASNPNRLGNKQLMQRAATDRSPYAELHEQVHLVAKQWMDQYGFYDVFLVAPDGELVYSYFKEIDFATNLVTGPFAGSGIGEAFQQARDGADPNGVFLTGFSPYLPSYNDQAAFLGAPVFVDGRRVGVLITQIPIDQIQAVVNFRDDWNAAGLGVSGESQLVDRQGRHLISSRRVTSLQTYTAQLRAAGFAAEVAEAVSLRGSSIGIVADQTPPMQAAIRGETVSGLGIDYLRAPVAYAAAPLEVLNQRYALMVKIDQNEAFAPVRQLTRNLAIAAALALALVGLIAGVIALRLAASINRPLGRFGQVVDKVTAGDRDSRVRLPPDDEIGVLATAFDHMLDERNAVQARIERENEDLNNSIIEIMTSVADLANRDLTVKVPVAENVTGAVADAINLMSRSTASALTRVQAISDAVSNSSRAVRERAELVSAVANTASDQATSAATEIQQTAVALRSMGQIAADANQQAERALKSTADALNLVRSTVNGISASRDQIRETEKRIKRLAERSQEVTAIVNIIGQIAERTSVLALNASMQAVAAGDAGRGFAVVADEVKRLAENARDATQQIGGLVNAIQADTRETLQAMNGTISQVVDISRLADRAGGQMDDTRGATEQLVNSVRNISEAAQTQNNASQTLLTRAYELLQASQQTLDEIGAQREETESLTRSATELVGTVGQFRLPTSV